MCAVLLLVGTAAFGIDDRVAAIIDPHAENRFDAVAEAGELGAEAVEPFAPYKDNDDVEIRRAAQEALQRVVMYAGQSDAEEEEERAAVAQAWTECLSDDYSAHVQREVLNLLSTYEDKDEVDAIAERLHKPNLTEAACHALMRTPPSVRVLVTALEEADEETRRCIAYALAQKAVLQS